LATVEVDLLADVSI